MDKVMKSRFTPQADSKASTVVLDHPAKSELLPSPAPLAMPEQVFERRFKGSSNILRRETLVSRIAILFATLLVTMAFAWELYGVLSTGTITPIQITFLIFSTLAFSWVALGTLNSALGFLHLYTGEKSDQMILPDNVPSLNSKTALLFPVFKEVPTNIAGTIEALAFHLQETGKQQHFDIFVLSDTPDKTETETGHIERRTFEALKHHLSGVVNVYYRRRRDNEGKKSGNIREWIERFGARYQHFIILDADSVMSAPTMIKLAAAMESSPKTGLIQTVPKLAGAHTLFQRLQQFANNVYGPAAAAGLATWHGEQGNYWGHNAIIRTVAFAGSAGLPKLKGKAPFGGHIQSHDFVEAALMQRAGWAIRMSPTTEGSFEGAPPSLMDLVARDRRWAQGNLQHISILRTRGLTFMGRLHLLFGAVSYLSAMVWAVSLVLGILLALQGSHMIPTYFKDEVTLFPIWPISDPGPSLRLFIATIIVVLLTKLLGALLEIQRSRKSREENGTIRTIAGVITETIFAMLMAPILMVTQSMAVIEIFIGRDSGWSVQTRDGQNPSFYEAQSAFWIPTLSGLLMTAICLWVSLELTAWMAPILIGTLFAGPLAWYTARPSMGILSAILSTPEDRSTPAILDHTARSQHAWANRLSRGFQHETPQYTDDLSQAA